MGNSNTKEGEVTKTIEKQTAKVPSDVFLFTAMGIMAVSLVLKVSKQHKTALFVGQWVAPVLLFGIYNKLVKQQGHDAEDKNEEEEIFDNDL